MRSVGRPPLLARPSEPANTQPVSRSAFARYLGCAPSRITEWVSAGRITGAALADASRVIPSIAVQQLEAAGSFAKSPAPPAALEAVAAGRAVSFDEARAAREALKAHTALLDLRERHGELVDVATAEAALFGGMRAVRDQMQGWPMRAAPEMAARLGIEAAPLLTELERAMRRELTALADPQAPWRASAKALEGAA